MAATPLQELIGERVATVREERGWTQAELASSVTARGFSISGAGISRIESGIRQLGVVELVQLATALSVPAMALLPQEDSGLKQRDDDSSLVEVAGVEISARYLCWWFTGGLPDQQSGLVADPGWYRRYRTPQPLRRDNLDNRLVNLLITALVDADEAMDRGDEPAWQREQASARTLFEAFVLVGDVAARQSRQDGPSTSTAGGESSAHP